MENETTQAQAAETSSQTVAKEGNPPVANISTPTAPLNPEDIDMSKLSLDQIETIMMGGQVAIALNEQGGEQVSTSEPESTAVEQQVPPVAEGQQTQQPPATVQSESQPPVATESAPKVEVPPAKEDENLLPERYRFSDTRDQAILSLKKLHPDKSWAEIETLVGPSQGLETQSEETTPTSYADQYETERANLEEMEARRLEMAEDEGTDNTEKTSLDHEIMKSTARVAILEQQARDEKVRNENAARQSSETHKVKQQDSRNRALASYPSVADANSPLGKAVANRIAELRANDDPLLYSADAAETITIMEAVKLGINPASQEKPPVKQEAPAAPVVEKTQAPAVVAAPTVTSRPAVPPPGSASTVAASQPKHQQQQDAVAHLLSDDATLEELDAAFGADKTPFIR